MEIFQDFGRKMLVERWIKKEKKNNNIESRLWIARGNSIYHRTQYFLQNTCEKKEEMFWINFAELLKFDAEKRRRKKKHV